ncbi:two-component regulator propeller domain-containing protein [Spirosoma sp.]|uniref:two-component regulator propeller domain-containing protein n=1 Tax=Spirosoma sp. TaxID=1899569 RepID=UPI003B3A5DBE
MMPFRLLSFLLLYVASMSVVPAQSLPSTSPRIRFEHITVVDGLPENSVTCMLQDHLGFMWLGTQNGLVRYDGTTMVVYQYNARNKFSLKGRHIQSLCEDHNGDIWVGCERLFRFERTTQRFIEYPRNSPRINDTNESTRFIHEDKQGHIWTIRQIQNSWLLDRLTPKTRTWTYFRHEPANNRSLAANSIYYNTVDGLVSFAFLEDRTGKVWVTTTGETTNTLHWLDPGSNRFIRFKPRTTPQLAADFAKITFIAEDKQNNLYLSSFAAGKGLFRLNPRTGQLTQFKNNPQDAHSIQSDSLNGVYQSRNGMIWVPTLQGMDRLDPKTGTFEHLTSKFNDPTTPALARVLCERDNGDLWFLTSSGLNCYSQRLNQFISYQSRPDEAGALHAESIHSFLVDRTGLIWVGSLNSGLNKQSRLAKFPLLSNSPLAGNKSQSSTIYSVYEAPSDPSVLWLSTDKGLDKVDKKTGASTHYRYNKEDPHSLGRGKVTAIAEDNRGRLWVATQASGLNLMDRQRGTFTHFSKNPAKVNSLLVNTITCLLPASDGTLWLGTDNGLDHFDVDRQTFTHYYKADTSYVPDLYRRIGQLTTKQRYVASILHPGNAIDRVVPFTLLQTTDLLVIVGGEWRSTVKYDYGWIEDAQGNVVWQATQTGSRADGLDGQVRSQIKPIRLVAGRYRLRYKSDDDYAYGNWNSGPPKHPELWGIQLYRLNATEAIDIAGLVRKREFTGLSDNAITVLREDARKQLWIGLGSGGVQVLNTLTGKFQTYRDNLNGPLSVRDILPATKTGLFWVGDNIFGLLLLDNKGRILKSYNAANGLSSNSALTIQRDHGGKLWIGTNNGLSRFDPKTGRFIRYTSANGLPDGVINHSSKTSDGIIYISGAKGTNAFSPDQITTNPVPPAIVLTDLVVGGHSATFRTGRNPIHISGIRQLTLLHNQNELTFHFSALLYDRDKESQYAYRLTPIDKDWVFSGITRQARYNDLRPGTYTFRVKAANADGVWNEKGISLRIVVRPPWWRTWWAYLLYAGLAGGSLWAFMQYRSKALRQKNQLLEAHVAQRTREVQQQKEEIVTQRDHLESTLEDLQKTQQQLIQKEKLASLGELTAGIAHEIQNPLNFVNNFSQVSTELLTELKEGPFQKLPDNEKDFAEEILSDLTNNLRKIHRHGNRASSIVKDMLEHSRTESGEKRPIHLNALAEEYLKLAYHGMRAKDKTKGGITESAGPSFRFNCELVTSFDANLGRIDVVPQEIGRVLLNLYSNAFYAVAERAKAAHAHRQGGLAGDIYSPVVRVSTALIKASPEQVDGSAKLLRHRSSNPTEGTEQAVQIRIQDNGIGIPETIREKIFHPFFTTKPVGEGTGLGLSLSYDIITKGHGGTLTVESTEGQGTEFIITLPIS